MVALDDRLNKLESVTRNPERFVFVFFANEDDFERAEREGRLPHPCRVYIGIDPEAI